MRGEGMLILALRAATGAMRIGVGELLVVLLDRAGEWVRICIGSGLWEVRTPKVHSAAGELFWLCRPMGSSPAHIDLLCRDPASAGWDGRGIGAIPRDFARLGSANPLAPFQEGGN